MLKPALEVIIPSIEKTGEFTEQIQTIFQSDAFRAVATYREQVGILCKSLRTEEQHCTYELIGRLFNPVKAGGTIREAYLKYCRGDTKNGRHASLLDSELADLKECIKSAFTDEGYPTVFEIEQKIFERYNKILDTATVRSIIKRMPEFALATAEPMEMTRYNCPFDSIKQYYEKLGAIGAEVEIGWMYNVDEAGQQNFVDAHKMKVVIRR